MLANNILVENNVNIDMIKFNLLGQSVCQTTIIEHIIWFQTASLLLGLIVLLFGVELFFWETTWKIRQYH